MCRAHYAFSRGLFELCTALIYEKSREKSFKPFPETDKFHLFVFYIYRTEKSLIQKTAIGFGSGAAARINCHQSKLQQRYLTKFTCNDYERSLHNSLFLSPEGVGISSILADKSRAFRCDWRASERIRCFRVRFSTRCSSRMSCRYCWAPVLGELSCIRRANNLYINVFFSLSYLFQCLANETRRTVRDTHNGSLK